MTTYHGMDRTYWTSQNRSRHTIDPDGDPCPCWMSGNDINAYDPSDVDHLADRYQHPDEFRAGVMARYETNNDI